MTFLIITEDPARAAGLAKRIKEQSPDSFCFPVVPSAVEEALRTIRVDCAVCPPALAAAPVLGNAPCRAVWPPETSAEDMADHLLYSGNA